VTDYSKLELKFERFLHQFEKYRSIYIKFLETSDCDTNCDLYEEQRKLGNQLSKQYGELQANIHGMAGYNELIIHGVKHNIFLSALSPITKNNTIKNHSIEYSIQCLNKAIGSCRHAKKVNHTDDQIIISKGAEYQGILEIRRIFKEAKKKLCIQDRYLSADIFHHIEEIDTNVKIKIIIKKENYPAKAMLKSVYNKYQSVKQNVKIREYKQEEFHSRIILIDDNKGYSPDFSLRDIGKNTSYLSKIQDIKKSTKDFKNLWSIATPL